MIYGIMRHGEAVRDFPGQILGRTNDRGLVQEGLNSHLRGFLSTGGLEDRPRVIWASPLARCVETAFLITERSGVGVQVKEWLTERDYRGIEKPDDVYPPGLDWGTKLYHRPNKLGESLLDVYERIVNMVKKRDCDGVLFVTHELPAQVLYSNFTDTPFQEVYKSWSLEEGEMWRPEYGEEIRRVVL